MIKKPKKNPKNVKRHLPEIILLLAVFLVFFMVFSMRQEELLQNLRTAFADAAESDLFSRLGITPILARLSGNP